MANITKGELDSFNRVNSGGFGTIYEHDGKAYKVYHKDVKTDFEYVKNPALKHSRHYKNKIRRMIDINDKLVYTDLPDDILFIDNKFQGVVMPYYEGDTVYQLIDKPLLKKIALSRQMIRNARELTEHHIYTFDYKLINMIVSNGKLKYIDLDDVLTKVTYAPNPFYNRKSIGILDETIKAFFRENEYSIFNTDIRNNITKQYEDYYTYDGIETYLISKAINHTYVLISEDTDVSLEILRDPQYKVILVMDTSMSYYYSHIMGILMRLKENNIPVYEIIDERKLNNYLNDIAYNGIIDYRCTKKRRLIK